MDNLTPLGALLEAAREKRGLSQNEAARRARTSGTGWRRVITGRAKISGVEVDYPGKAATVARMAAAVGLDVYQVEHDGKRPDVARELPDAYRLLGTADAPRPVLAASQGEEEWRRQKIAEARAVIREALAGLPEPDDVDEIRLEERIARIRRDLDQEGDTGSAAEIGLYLKLYEKRSEG